MVKTFLGVVALLAVSACGVDRYEQPIKLTPHGSAVRVNMAAQIIDPNPPAQSAKTSDGARAALGVDAYRRGEVKDPTAQSTAPDTTAIEEVQ